MPNQPDLLARTAAAYLRKSRMEEGLDTQVFPGRHPEGLGDCDRRGGLHLLEY